MDPQFESRWRDARTQENLGRPLKAKAIYEDLLRADPERLYVRLRLSAIEEGLGHYRASKAHAVQCAETVRTQRWHDLAAVTRRLLTFDEQQLVGELILGADWRDPAIIKNSVVLSQHLWLVGLFEEAVELIEVAEKHVAPNHLLSYSKANALRYMGRMDAATEEFEKCIRLAPSFPYAHWSLASHRKSLPPGARVQRIKQAKAAFTPDADERAYLDYALFKELDSAGEPSRAWRHLLAGAAIKRRSLHYDSKGEEAGHAALQRMTSADFCRTRDHGDIGFVPIFILGMPRTGTTLVERIIGGHSQVTAGGELNDFNTALCLATDTFLGTFVTEHAVERLAEADFQQVGRDYRSRVQPRLHGKHFLTDKNPANFAYAGLIAKALPHARIVCLRRDPMDACFSNLKELFASDAYGYSYDLVELADYYARFDRLCKHWKNVIPDNFMEVQYEELVTNPSSATEGILQFCGLPFEPGCLDITRNTAPVATASSSQVREPINVRSVGAWRRYAEYLEPLKIRFHAEMSE
jgi:tetratricopeptide (TPR) repeat protein